MDIVLNITHEVVLIGSGEMEEPKSIIHVAMGILAFLSISGTIGNALVLYVFSRQKQKLSSTIFILTLAGTDFITSLVTMPFTIAIESVDYMVHFDLLCKTYHLLVTTTIPFSAFVMVAIAVDRYLCIVHPFKHIITIPRAQIIVVCLAILAFTLGLLCCLMYGVYKEEIFPDYSENLTQFLMFNHFNLSSPFLFNNTNITASSHRSLIVFTGKCHRNDLIFSQSFFMVYQKIYSSFFGICAVIVIVLYTIIYRSVLTRRRRRFHMKNTCTCFCLFTQNHQVENEHEQTEFTVLSNSKDKSPTGAGSRKKFQEDSFKDSDKNKDDKNGNVGPDREALVRPSGVSRAKLEKLRMANIKTALMLSIVALTYIICFMPAWLMAHNVVQMNAIVFYLYFTYNVANPIIYAFLNQSFRNHLQTLFKCS